MENENYAYEVCPHCGEEVRLDAELKVQTCPNCGKRIVACSMCLACSANDGKKYCSNCCLCYQADLENQALEMLREWAVEFENWWLGHDQAWRDRNSYMVEVDQFAQRKARAYARELEEMAR